MLSFFHHTLCKNCPKCTKRPTGLDSHQSNMAGRCLHVKLYMEWKLYLKTFLSVTFAFIFDVCKHQFLKLAKGESRIIYTLDLVGKIVNIWQKEIFLCTPLLGISQWVSWQFAPDIVPRFNNLCTVLWIMLHFYYSWVFWVLHIKAKEFAAFIVG